MVNRCLGITHVHNTSGFPPFLKALPLHGRDRTSSKEISKGSLTKRSFQLVFPGVSVAEAVHNCAFPKELCLNGADCPYYSRLFLLLEH